MSALFRYLAVVWICGLQGMCQSGILEQFRETGYSEICDCKCQTTAFDFLYGCFDDLTAFLETNPLWEKKLYIAKERFIRSKDRNAYSTDVFGFYNESKRAGRDQVSFYYSQHFHQFLETHYPEFNKIPEFTVFFKACIEIVQAHAPVFLEASNELGLETPAILFKVVKYLPSYFPSKPHYDGSLFSLLLHSTEKHSLLLSEYKDSYKIEDFISTNSSCLLIPGTLLSEFDIYPTPHVVAYSGKTRHAAVAFAMRSNYTAPNRTLSPLPYFQELR